MGGQASPFMVFRSFSKKEEIVMDIGSGLGVVGLSFAVVMIVYRVLPPKKAQGEKPDGTSQKS